MAYAGGANRTNSSQSFSMPPTFSVIIHQLNHRDAGRSVRFRRSTLTSTSYAEGNRKMHTLTSRDRISRASVCAMPNDDRHLKSCFGLASLGLITTALLLATSVPATASERVEQLLEQMTIEEKLGQLTQQWGGKTQDINPDAITRNFEDLAGQVRAGMIGSFLGIEDAEWGNRLQREAVENSRLGIPLVLANDIIHGHRTIFPIPLGTASSWNLELIEELEAMAAREARAAGTHWTFAPMVDVTHDPRWGRIAEGAGECAWLGSEIAKARVRGFQGDDIRNQDRLIACAKHFVGYGGAEGGRDYNTVDASEAKLREWYLPPFKAAMEAGVGTMMSGFNEISGVPVTGDPFTLDVILRKEWGFDGMIVSDWTSVTEMVVHGYVPDNAAAAAKAISLGIDMDMSSFSYRTHLAQAVKDGRLSMDVIDTAVRRVLTVKERLGLFEQPYADPEREKEMILAPAHRKLAREGSAKSIVLLKNDNDLLPIRDNVKRIAVIGPLADSQKDPLGTWKAFGKNEDVVTVIQGIKNRAGDDVEIMTARGTEVRGEVDRMKLLEAAQVAEKADLAILVVGETEDMSGEGHSRAMLGLPGAQLDLVKLVQRTGTPTVVVLLHGRPLAIPWVAENVPSVLATWHLGVEHGNAVADVLWGDVNPSGRLTAQWPRHVGQVPIYYNFKNTGRPPVEGQRYTSKYIDMPWTPQFVFGHGLTYTKFEYGAPRLSKATINPDGTVEVTARIMNIGSRPGTETAQLYIRDKVASRTRPVRDLRGFEQVTLKPGESTDVTFTLGPKHLGLYNREMEFVVEPGEFEIWVGPNSISGQSTTLTVK